MAPPSPGHRRLWLLSLLVALLALAAPLAHHVRAASLLTRVADPEAHGWLADAGRHGVRVEPSAVGAEPARLYLPDDVVDPPGLVVVHGVHWKGIDEPRLQTFARAIASSGIAVLTPEVHELCDYRIAPASVDTIGRSTRVLSERLGGQRVGLMGLSFAGGLSLVAASDARYEDAIAFVVTLGAHDDLGRVLRFFVTDEAPRPDGSALHVHAHPYGTVVFIYSHVEDFFSPEDVETARLALRDVLHEDFDAARADAVGLSPAGSEAMRHVFEHDVTALAPALLAEIDRLQPQFAAVSPVAHVALHGTGDFLIPPSEAEWLARDIPASALRQELVSAAIEHVGLEPGTSVADELALVHFMSEILELTEARGRGLRSWARAGTAALRPPRTARTPAARCAAGSPARCRRR